MAPKGIALQNFGDFLEFERNASHVDFCSHRSIGYNQTDVTFDPSATIKTKERARKSFVSDRIWVEVIT
jgi:hypothetical protein